MHRRGFLSARNTAALRDAALGRAGRRPCVSLRGPSPRRHDQMDAAILEEDRFAVIVHWTCAMRSRLVAPEYATLEGRSVSPFPARQEARQGSVVCGREPGRRTLPTVATGEAAGGQSERRCRFDLAQGPGAMPGAQWSGAPNRSQRAWRQPPGTPGCSSWRTCSELTTFPRCCAA
jgi:hypothetical protein